MDGLWQSKGGRVLVAALLVGLAAVALVVLLPNRQPAGLGGTAWTLVAYGPADSPMAAEAPASITFEANGRFSGSTGCNQFFGNYRAADGQLSFVDDEVAFTAMGCDPATAEGQQEEFFRSHLSQIRYTQTADQLTLRFADGQVAEYVRAQ